MKRRRSREGLERGGEMRKRRRKMRKNASITITKFQNAMNQSKET